MTEGTSERTNRLFLASVRNLRYAERIQALCRNQLQPLYRLRREASVSTQAAHIMLFCHAPSGQLVASTRLFAHNTRHYDETVTVHEHIRRTQTVRCVIGPITVLVGFPHPLQSLRMGPADATADRLMTMGCLGCLAFVALPVVVVLCG